MTTIDENTIYFNQEHREIKVVFMWKPVPYCLAFMGMISTYHTTKKKNNHLSNQSVNTANYNDFPENICLLEQVPWKYSTIF